MSDITDLSDTIKPKSDQLNADDLLTGPKIVTITKVQRGNSSEQPVWVQLEGDLQPYKPCKTMRRVLIAVWGEDGSLWVGRSMQLFCNPAVTYGGVRVGGIQISHVSHIDAEVVLELTTARGKRSTFRVKPLAVQAALATMSMEQRVAAAVAAYGEVTTETALADCDRRVVRLLTACSEEQANQINDAREAAIKKMVSV